MSKNDRQVLAVAMVVGSLVLCYLLFPRIGGGGAALQSECKNNLKQIGLALENYRDAHGSYPPAYIADANGVPIHSWRVLLLPYLDQAPLYNQYDFDEPWNGPKNRELTSTPLLVFQCPSDRSGLPTRTNYVAVVGGNTAWPDSEGLKHKDNKSDVVQVIETVDTGIEWAEPRDFALPQMSPHINSQPCCGPASRHKGGAHAVYLDGSVEFIQEKMSAEELYRRLLVEKK